MNPPHDDPPHDDPSRRAPSGPPTPTGRLVRTREGYDLVLTRTFRAPVEDVWASVTEPARTARWFGEWRGEAGPGRVVEMRMAFEEGAPWCAMRIDACEPPYRLAVSMADGSASEASDASAPASPSPSPSEEPTSDASAPGEPGVPHASPPEQAGDADPWPMELLLSEADGVTELRLVHHRPSADGVGEIGPGWEFYLDLLVASRAHAPLPDFTAYYPAQRAYFASLPTHAPPPPGGAPAPAP
ncbi:SRPBCC family protein [Streptomyces sp. Z26]|nr:SRPBCC family protein [Streptomyces sp. Z26]RLL67897.1 SRPBCC family protein [Streptomyces sp. Z26]